MKSKQKDIPLIRILFFIVFLSLIAYLIFNENGVIKYIRVKGELNKLNEEITKSEEQLKELDMEIDSLKYNMSKIERVARERYNMMLPNENVLKIEEN